MIYLTLPELIRVGERTLGGEVLVRDHGLLESALARPRATVLGAFLGVNGRRLGLTNAQAYDLVIAVARGELDDVDVIARRIETELAEP